MNLYTDQRILIEWVYFSVLNPQLIGYCLMEKFVFYPEIIVLKDLITALIRWNVCTNVYAWIIHKANIYRENRKKKCNLLVSFFFGSLILTKHYRLIIATIMFHLTVSMPEQMFVFADLFGKNGTS